MSKNFLKSDGEIVESYTLYGRRGRATVLISKVKDLKGDSYFSVGVIPETIRVFAGEESLAAARKLGRRMAQEEIRHTDRFEAAKRIVLELVSVM